MKKIEQGKYLYYIGDDAIIIEQINGVTPALWQATYEKTNEHYGIFDSIKQFKEKIKIAQLESQLKQVLKAYNMLEEYACQLTGGDPAENEIITDANSIVQLALNDELNN